MASAVFTWLLVILSSLSAKTAVGGGGPIPKPHIPYIASSSAVGGGGPISR